MADDDVRAAIGSGIKLSFWARAIRGGFWPSLINVSAALAVLLLVAGGPEWLGLALGMVSLAGTLTHNLWGNVRLRHATTPTGHWLPSRLLLLVGIAVLAEQAGAGSLLWAGLAGCVLATTIEPTIRATSEAGYPVAVNLPGCPVRTRPWFPVSWIQPLNIVALIALAVAVLTPVPAWPATLIAVGGAGAAAVAFLDASLRLARRHQVESRLTELIEGYGPQFALHWQAPAGTAYQVAMWLPYLERLGRPFVVIVRTEVNLREVIPLTTAPIVLRVALEDLDSVVPSTLKTVFYVNTAVRNSHLVRYSNLTHVQLNHGDSDKAPSFNPVFRMYDHDFVAGQAAIDRFAANGVSMPQEMFTIVGRPQVEDVQVATAPIATTEHPTVLYAPTWSGFYADSNYSSLSVGVGMVAALLERGCTVVFRPHPYARRTPSLAVACTRIIEMLRADAAATGRRHRCGDEAEQTMSIVDCFNASDALISDVSSVVADYLFSEKPMAMVAVTEPASAFTKHFPIAEAAYIVDAYRGKLTGFDTVLDDLLRTDPLLAVRRSVKTYYLGDIPAESYVQRFLDEATALLK